MAIWSRSDSSFEPNIFRPRVRSPYKLLKAFLDEARRQVDLYERIQDAHPDEFLEYFANCQIDTKGMSKDHYFRAASIRKILDRGRGDKPDPTLETIRRIALTKIEEEPDFDVLELIRAAGPGFGMAPIYQTIWEVQSWLDLIYSYSSSDDGEAKLELIGLEQLETDIAVLKVYLKIETMVGFEELLKILDGEPGNAIQVKMT